MGEYTKVFSLHGKSEKPKEQEELMNYTPEQIADKLDYAVLNPLDGMEEVKSGAIYCLNNRIKSICVASVNVGVASQYHPNVSSVVAFPHGNVDPKAKLREAQRAVDFGATELDVVLNFGRFLSGDQGIILRELEGICEMAHDNGVLVKSILEVCYYTPNEIFIACQECVKAEVDLVKTSTGFGPCGADYQNVWTMLDAVRGTGVGVKASGGIHSYADVAKFLRMGVSRIGASRYKELLP